MKQETINIYLNNQQSIPQKQIIDFERSQRNIVWKQCKFYNKSIPIRSYTSMCLVNNKLYIYGGQQVMKGCLSDFYKINLQSKNYIWEQVKCLSQQNPGPKSRHSSIYYNKKIIFFGGISNSSINNNNQLYDFDLDNHIWTKNRAIGKYPPPLDLHAAVYHKSQYPQMLVLGGFDGQVGEYTNAIYSLNLQFWQWKTIIKHKQGAMLGRAGFAYCSDQNSIYIFAGKTQDKRLNDLWRYDIENQKYIELCKKNNNDQQIPKQRSGSTIAKYNHYLIMFGGLHDITLQLDDLMLFNLNSNKWTMIQMASPFIKQKKNVHSLKKKSEIKLLESYDISLHTNPQSVRKKKSLNLTNNNFLHLNQNKFSHNSSGIESFQKEKYSTGMNMIQEQKRKIFLLRKNKMLKEFQVNNIQQLKKMITYEPQEQKMKDSINLIKNSCPIKKCMKFDSTKPLESQKTEIIRQKPCARDGHNCYIYKRDLYIFGGDRHKMTFNDLYKLDLQVLI